MSKYALDNLLGSKGRVKLLKFMFRNHPKSFTAHELARRAQEPLAEVQRELVILKRIGLIIKRHHVSSKSHEQ